MNISVIMPAYNAGQFIESAVASVLKQTFTTFELLIIDDCSTDDTWNIMQKLLKTDPRIRIFRNPKNAGVSFTRNFGVTKARYAWIAFLDSDDMWDKEKLEKQVDLIQINHAEFVFSGASFIDECGRSSGHILHIPERIGFGELLKQNVISCSSVVIKSDLLKENPMQRDDLHEDFAVWLRILKNGLTAYGIDEPLLIYRVQANSKSGNKIKAAKMTYKVYRFVGLNFFQAIYNMIFYALRNIYKYRKIYSKFNDGFSIE